jgi:hypothetical protein
MRKHFRFYLTAANLFRAALILSILAAWIYAHS